MCGSLDKRLPLILNAKSIVASLSSVIFMCHVYTSPTSLLTAVVRSLVRLVIKERENEN